MDIPEINNIISRVTRIAETDWGYNITTITHSENQGKVESQKAEYTVYDRSAQLQHDKTGSHINTLA